MIMNNEKENISRNRKRGIDRRMKIDDKIRSILNKIKCQKKNEKFDKIKELKIELV